MLWKKGVSTSAELCFCSLICFMAGGWVCGPLGMWGTMSVGNRAVISCDVWRGIITSNVLSDGKRRVRGQGVHFVSLFTRLEIHADLLQAEKKDRRQKRLKKSLDKQKKGKNMMLERQKTEAEGVAPWVVWESPVSFTCGILVRHHLSYNVALSPYRPVNTPMELFCSFNANI